MPILLLSLVACVPLRSASKDFTDSSASALASSNSLVCLALNELRLPSTYSSCRVTLFARVCASAV